MIDAQHLVKWYGPTRAVDDLTFHIEPGQIVGFLGPNGAGKSTTLRILTGYLPPTSGAATIAGHNVLHDPEAARSKVGYLPESTPLYAEMRVEEFLHYRGQLMGMSRSDRKRRLETVCDRCGLTAVRRRVIGHLSKGNRQRVGLAQALLHEPPVLILDEPTAGLDPNQIGEVRKLIGELRGHQTILISTHILPEVEKIADRVMIIAGGRIAAEGTPEELRQKTSSGGRLLIEAQGESSGLKQTLVEVAGVSDVQIEQRDGWCRAILTSDGDDDLREAVGRTLVGRGYPIRELRRETGSLEAFFVQITAQQNQAVAAPQPAASAV